MTDSPRKSIKSIDLKGLSERLASPKKVRDVSVDGFSTSMLKNDVSSILNISSVEKQIEMRSKYVEKEYWTFLEDSGIRTAFEVIFNEIIANRLQKDEVFSFAANRLKEIGKKLQDIDDL